MTPEQQRIAIAESCGWKTGYRDPEAWHPLPDYLNDLNAMHEAEQVLFPVKVHDLHGPDLVKEYGAILQHLCCGHPGGAIRATASQRAEAFLRTIGKWEEAK
jgi:hypothetical protein